MSLTFDSEKHEYRWDDKIVPSVSEILRATGQAKDWKDVPPYYRDRGIACHAAIHLYLLGTLDEDSVDEAVKPYLNQFKEWNKTQDMYVPVSEQPLYSKRLKFAGTPDLLANGVIWDLKCSKKLDKASTFQYQMQGAAYRTLVLEDIGMTYPFKILLLTGEGNATEIELDAPVKAWEAIMTLYDIKTGRAK